MFVALKPTVALNICCVVDIVGRGTLDDLVPTLVQCDVDLELVSAESFL